MEPKAAILYILDNFVGTIAAIIALATVVGKFKPIGDSLKHFFFIELYIANEKQDKRLDNLEMYQLKQIICDRRLPDGDRLNAGDEYIKRGGNGEIKMIYEAIKDAAKKKRFEKEQEQEV
jgi:hypothetical protein